MTGVARARAYLDEHGTDAPVRTAAKRLYALYPDSYTSLEGARAALNAVLGRKGPHGHTHDKPPGRQSDRPSVPEPWPDDWQGPWCAPVGTALVLPDLHVPHHDPQALETALTWRTDWDYVVLPGDALNCSRLSMKFVAESGAPTVAEEKRALGSMLDMLTWYDKPVYYYPGNHEERWWQFMARRVPEISDDPDATFERFFGLDRRGVETISAGRTLLFGKLHGFHGHEVSANSPFTPQSPASWLMRQTQVNAFCGHFHRSNEATSRRADGAVIGCWTMGCLCTLTPRYARRNQWNHGFAVVDFDESGFEIHNKKILHGKVY